MPADLVAFLRARLDERQRVAEDAAAAVRRWPKDNPPPWDRARLVVANMQAEFGGHARRASALDAFEGRESPAEVLADVATKRAIIDMVEQGDLHDGIGDHAAFDVLRLLVQPFAGHPHFHPSWSPR